MSGSILPVYRWQVFNGSTPATGAKLYSFLSGGSTPHPLYSNADLDPSHELTNPVVADPSGVFPIMYMDAVNYRIRIDQSDGSALFLAQDDIYDLWQLFTATTQTANTVYAGPSSGSPAVPSFRALVSADLPSGVQPFTVVTTTMTGTQDNFAPGLSYNTILRCNNATLLTIDGFAGGVQGQRLVVLSVGAGQVDFAPQNTGSIAANRLINFATVGTTSLAAGVGVAEYVYDATSSRWRLVSHDQGAWITRTFAAGNYTAATSTWTVASATTDAYYLRGRTLTFSEEVTGTLGGTPTSVSIAIPGSFVAAKAMSNTALISNGGTVAGGQYSVAAAGTTIAVLPIGSSWATSALVNITIAFEVQ